MVLGSTGLLGQALCREALARDLVCLGASRSSSTTPVNATRADELVSVIAEFRPDVVINCVAEVSLALCEGDPGLAYLVNARPAALLGRLSVTHGFYFMQISTDHFYTGDGDAAHDEECRVQLCNEYASTKWAGEQFALCQAEALVVRTNIVGFRGREGQPTFLEWVLQSFEQKSPLTMFEDYFTSSLDVSTCARALLDLAPLRPSGRLNLAAAQISSKKDFILSLARRLGVDETPFRAGSLRALAGPPRAESCGLDVSRAQSLLPWRLPNLDQVVDQLAREYLTQKSSGRFS